MPNQRLSDLELILAVINDDEKAFNELFERHWARVYAIAFKYVKDEENSLEIAHDIFLNIWNKRHELNITSFQSYVSTAASYHGIRKRQTLKAVPIDYVEDIFIEGQIPADVAPVSLNDGEVHLDRLELEHKIDTLLNDLPKRCREIYTLSRKENLSIAEISERFNISKRTVENQLTVALKHLRKALEYAVVVSIINAVL